MSTYIPKALKDALDDRVAESIAGSLGADATSRDVYGTVRLPGKVTAVVGMRRAGKTTFVHQLRRDRLAHGAPRTSLPYINFEDERLAGLEAAHLGILVDVLRRRASHADTPVTWYFDEIQVVPGWERFVRRLLDAGGNEVVVTGSSAALLSREIATALRGRAWEVPLYPFSFAEVLRHRGDVVPAQPALAVGEDRARLERALADWLTVGGFPEAQGLDVASRRQLLRDYVDVAMLRDIVERHRVSNVTALRWMVRHLLGNAGARFSVEKFYASLKSQGVSVSKDTVHHLLAHVADCFLVRTVWMESASERQRMVNPRKVYPVDPGLITTFDRSGRTNVGHALETAVLIELERRRLDVTYVRTASGYEVDFLTKDASGRMELIQVCADASDPDTAGRELRALSDAGAMYPHATRRLLTMTHDGAPAETPADTVVQTAYEWLLDPAPIE